MYTDIPEKLKEKLLTAPRRPGVYHFKDDSGETLYIGKAVNLYNRSRSYFANYRNLDPRLQNMVELAKDVEYYEVNSEVEALLLETNLIKKYQPKYNVLMTDDKSYLWIKVYSQMDFPIVKVVREKKDDGADYFGPFPGRGPITRMLKSIRKVFRYRTCERTIEERVDSKTGVKKIYSSDRKPCLFFHIGLCSAPCIAQQTKSDYRENINGLKRFFRSEHRELKESLTKTMKDYATKQEFERAALVRDKLKDIDYLTQMSMIDEKVDENVLAVRKAEQSIAGLSELIYKLGLFSARPEEIELSDFKIECYDISNIQGTNATAAMVVSVGGKSRKDLYRKFKIKTKSTPDDFAMLQEVLTRRLKHLLANPGKETPESDISFSKAPDLLVIDGGKGQLSSVLKILHSFEEQLGYVIPCIGLAKREEEVFIPEELLQSGVSESMDNPYKLLKLNRRSPALKILQNLRDEAHRFGIGYHRLLRSKGMIYSELDLIPGVGEVTKKKLILAFGSVIGIKKASIEDINTVIKNLSTARKIKKLLR